MQFDGITIQWSRDADLTLDRLRLTTPRHPGTVIDEMPRLNCTTMHCLHHKLQTTNLFPLTDQLSAGDNSGAGCWSSCRDY
eukprot:scaffold1120_cov131-Skeletonema_marinoi.AAC.2